MKKITLLVILAASIPCAGGTLHSEALSFLERLSSQGYTGTGIIACRLNLLEPCTVMVYPPLNSSTGGFYAALGGNNIFDLGLRLEGKGWFLEDTMPDDYPVLRLDSAQVSGGRRLIICAYDMIRGFKSDSVAVVWAFSPVDRTD
ncbi:MAG: hypothetical protein GQ565_06605 [Candidatus Aegiribacteria sp.]|nr:hypothetical protein [Candidatus Aegiribacteria sp.]